MLLDVFEEKVECYVEQKSTNLPRIASKNSERAMHAVILPRCHWHLNASIRAAESGYNSQVAEVYQHCCSV